MIEKLAAIANIGLILLWVFIWAYCMIQIAKQADENTPPVSGKGGTEHGEETEVLLPAEEAGNTDNSKRRSEGGTYEAGGRNGSQTGSRKP